MVPKVLVPCRELTRLSLEKIRMGMPPEAIGRIVTAPLDGTKQEHEKMADKRSDLPWRILSRILVPLSPLLAAIDKLVELGGEVSPCTAL